MQITPQMMGMMPGGMFGMPPQMGGMMGQPMGMFNPAALMQQQQQQQQQKKEGTGKDGK